MKKYIVAMIIIVGIVKFSGEPTPVQSVTPEKIQSAAQTQTVAKKTLPVSQSVEKKDYKYTDMNYLEDELITLVNEYRKENGLKPVKKTDFLQDSAQFKSVSMLEYDYFGHDNPYLGPNKGSVWLADNYLKLPSYHGENIYYTSNTNVSARHIFEKFKSSPSHNGLMLNNKVGIIGIGIIKADVTGSYYDGLPALLVTQHYGY